VDLRHNDLEEVRHYYIHKLETLPNDQVVPGDNMNMALCDLERVRDTESQMGAPRMILSMLVVILVTKVNKAITYAMTVVLLR
jgi:hypothetical protein